MAQRDRFSLQKTLERLYSQITSGSTQSAVAELELLVKQWPEQPDVLHLAGLAYKGSDQPSKAIQFFKRSLEVNAQQPQVLNNVANLLKSRGEYQQAIEYYLSAIKLQPDYLEASRNLAICYYAADDFERSERHLHGLLSFQGNDLVALTALANCYQKTDRLELAKKTYQKVLNLDPNYTNALYNLGVSHHLDKETEDALSLYRHAYDTSPSERILLSLVSALHELGKSEEAILFLTNQLDQNATNIILHERLNDMLWQAGKVVEFGVSYRKAIASEPTVEDLRVSYISQLITVAELDKAQAELNEALLLFSRSPRLLELQATLHADRFEYQLAYVKFSESLQYKFSISGAQQLVKLCIILENYRQAQALLDRVFNETPECQLNWALQGLVWGLCGDSRASWLNNYEQFIQEYRLPTPDGYDSLNQFLTALKNVVLQQHLTQKEPLNQTLRGGTQTSSRLFHNKSKEIQELVSGLTTLISSYVDSLPDDNEHPFLRRKKECFKFSGSWSVNLEANGFHVNHIHTQGWISSSCYISLPQAMMGERRALEGAIKFGESPLSLGDRERVEKTIMPSEGGVVLFPSYFWHGTYPFKGNDSDHRLTAPFDVVPM